MPLPPLPTAPTVGVDTGRAWTGFAVIADGVVVDAATVQVPAVSDVNDHPRLAAAVSSVLDALDRFVEPHAPLGEPVGGLVVAVEAINTPQSMSCPKCRRGNAARRGPVPVLDWLIPRTLAAAVAGAWHPAVVVPAGWKKAFDRDDPDWRTRLPTELRGPRPRGFAGNVHPRRVRDHEQDAALVACLAWTQALVRAG